MGHGLATAIQYKIEKTSKSSDKKKILLREKKTKSGDDRTKRLLWWSLARSTGLYAGSSKASLYF